MMSSELTGLNKQEIQKIKEENELWPILKRIRSRFIFNRFILKDSEPDSLLEERIKHFYDKNINDAERLYDLMRIKGSIELNNQEISSLLNKGTWLYHQEGRYFQTPLHIASREGHNDIVTALLKSGAYINATDISGKTPLHIAVENGHNNIVTKLLSAEAYVNATDKFGYTALHYAAEKGNTNIVKELLSKGAYVNATNEHGKTPLHLAAEAGRTETVKVLLERDGIKVNAANKHGGTPLHLAARGGNTDIVLALLDSGADVDIANNFGETPIDLALSLPQNGEYKEKLSSMIEIMTKSRIEATENSVEEKTEDVLSTIQRDNSRGATFADRVRQSSSESKSMR
ncbi:MAG: ankyrin repeat domain-containing protein [Rickettsiales bacterium]|nr:MAG: ankyrin repeat domain-containing protein [Rickettsiales bacterium]